MSVYDSGIALLGERSSFQEAFSKKKNKNGIAKKRREFKNVCGNHEGYETMR